MIEHYDVSPLENSMIGVGTRRDPHEYTQVRNIGGCYSREALDAYYTSSWACRRVVEILPRLMCREWGQMTLNGDTEEFIHEQIKKYSSDVVKYSNDLNTLESRIKLIEWVKNRHKVLHIRQKFKQAQNWANLYGSAYILILAEDGNEDYEQPLEPSALTKIEKLIVLDTYQIYPEGVTNYERINPEYYCLYTDTLSTSKLILPDGYKANNKIHKTRILEFIGNELPARQRSRNNGHGASVLEPFIDVWQRFFVGYASLSRTLTNFNIFVHYIDGLFQQLWQGGRDAEKKLSDRLSVNQLSVSAYRGYVADKSSEKMDFISQNLSGASGIADCLKDELIAASGLPGSVLFGQFAAGLDASGKITGEQRYLNDLVREAQQDKFQDNIESLNDLLLVESDSPDDDSVHGWEWEALYTESPKEKAEIAKLYAEADKINVETGLLVSGGSKEQKSDPPPSKSNDQHPTTNDQHLLIDDSTPVKKIIKWQGFDIGLQYLPFEMRHGKILTAGYGHFRKTKGADGMAVDCYVGTNLKCPKLFVIEQLVNGQFDEEKYIIGVDSVEEARNIYLEVMPKEMLGSIKECDIAQLHKSRTDAEMLVISGQVLSEAEWEAIASVNDIDVQDAIANWKEVAPGSYKNILSAG